MINMENEEYVEHPVKKKVYTTLWACPRQLTHGWGCPSILERMNDFLGKKPDVYFGLTDGIEDEDGVTVDIDESNDPDVVADWKDLPFEDGKFEFSFWDPPYDKRYSKGLREILRVTSKRIAILHQLVYPNPDGWQKRAIIAVTTGPNMRIRCLQIYDRKGERLEEFVEEGSD